MIQRLRKVDDVKNVREMRALHPAGHFKTMWNMLVAACVLHDLVIIPVPFGQQGVEMRSHRAPAAPNPSKFSGVMRAT